MSDEFPLLSLRLGEGHYALPVAVVVEVAAMVAHTPVSGMAPEVLGVVNRHGEPLVLLDLRRVFGVEAGPVSAATMFIVIRSADRFIGLVVDEVLGVEYVTRITTTGGSGSFVQGIYQRGTEMVQVINVVFLAATFLPGEAEVPSWR